MFVGADYTLRKPTVKVTLPVTHAVAANLDVRNSLFLAPPLRESLGRKPGDLRNVLRRKQSGRPHFSRI